MTRHLILPILISLLFSSCSSDAPVGRVIVDLNRTISTPLTLSPVLSPDTTIRHIAPTPDGVYTIPTDSIPTGLYLATISPSLQLPLVIHTNATQRLCGTAQEWDDLTASDLETQAAITANRLRLSLSTASDSALAHLPLSNPTSRALAADSLTTLRAQARSTADAILNTLPDSSLAAIPLLGIPGLYDDVTDYRLLARRYGILSSAFPDIAPLRDRSAQLATLGRLIALRNALASGNPAPSFAFVTPSSDTITSASLAGRRFTIALLPDSATATRALEFVAIYAADGQRVLADCPANVPLPQKGSILRGRFVSLNNLQDLNTFAPALISVAQDATIASFRLGQKAKSQNQ